MNKDIRVMGEFPLFPGWLFTETIEEPENHRITVYGPGGVILTEESESREFAIAECLRAILKSRQE